MKGFPIDTGEIYFVGIGGIGMSGIADILINLGYKVAGSDIKENAMTARLARKGAEIKIGHRAKNVENASVVVVSSAIASDNPEIAEAHRLKIPVVRRAEMLAELMKMKKSIAVAGTHGKTTTTSLIASLLGQADMDPTVINGGVINAYDSNARLGSGDWIVVEADESDGSFTKLNSTIAVVTNIDFDHIDNFRDFSELKQLFMEFVENIPFYGTGILCVDHPEVADLATHIIDRKIITYGFLKSAEVSCENIKLTDTGSEFDVVFSKNIQEKYAVPAKWEHVSLNMFGEHNVQNSLAAIAVALELRISEENTRIALASFMGVKRRFTKISQKYGVTVIDDYAHHPVEIKAVLKTAQSVCKGKIFAVIQPHRYTRLRNFIDDFAQVLTLSDYAYVVPIYSAGEQPNGVDHFSLLEILRSNGEVPAEFTPNVEILCEKISALAKPDDFVIFLGAGDITRWAHEFAEIFKPGKGRN